jgi:5-dehydro-2-deoxygluconokinase
MDAVPPRATLLPLLFQQSKTSDFIASLTRGNPLKQAVLDGSAAAAMVVSRVGCAPAMPTRYELDHFITHHSGPTTA